MTTINSNNSLSKSRIQANLVALRELKAAKPNLAVLKGYTGWGGLRRALLDSALMRELNALLPNEEVLNLRSTLSSAYYTPPYIVQFIYCCLRYYDFQGGDVLEPAIGNGVFIEYMPDKLRQLCHITGIELDTVTSQMTTLLYPDINLINKPFEQVNPTNTYYDLIIGNPPYGASKVNDAKHVDISQFCIHHYFVAKSMRLLKPAGILVMVLPSYFLDNERDHTRDIIQQEGGHLLAAYRLPDNCFSDARVTIDIVFLTKKKTNIAWAIVQPIKIGHLQKPINTYFLEHSYHVFGNLEIIDMYELKGLSCKLRGDLKAVLRAEIERLKNAHAVKHATAQQVSVEAIKAQLAALQSVQTKLEKLVKQ